MSAAEAIMLAKKEKIYLKKIFKIINNSSGQSWMFADRGKRMIEKKYFKPLSRLSIFKKDTNSQDVPGFPVKILNVLGAGDAFAGGFLYGLLNGWDLYKSCRMGNASGAQVVTKKGCANFMPKLEESLNFIFL